MILNPAITDFDVDTFTYEYANGKTIAIVFIDEAFLSNGVPCTIKDAIIQIDDNGTVIRCPTIIGLGNEYMNLLTDNTELEGEKLSASNISECYIEIIDE